MLGDVVGRPGRQAVEQLLPLIRQRWQSDLVLVNAENAASGSGLTPKLYKRLCGAGADAITLGDHALRRAEIVPVLEQASNIIRPANLPAHAKGKGWMRLAPNWDGRTPPVPNIFVITILGRVYMNLPVTDPFGTLETVLANLPELNPIVIVEMHAEATSEKVAMGWHLDGRVAAVLGSHTHVATADARVLPKGTAYITDLGMCGPYASVLGRDVGPVLTHMTTATHVPFRIAEGDPRVSGVCVEIDDQTGLANSIERIEMAADTAKPPFVHGT